jgi:hypothetical protein
MSHYFTQAASEIAAAFGMLRVGISVTDAVSPQLARVPGTGLTNADFGKGHPPRGISLC